MSIQSPDSKQTQPLALTRKLARYAAQARYSILPANVRLEASRAFLNWMGCALGGSREPAVQLAAATATELGGGPQASIIGHAHRTDIASAAFVNCISSSVLGFDDAHLATVTHPSSPVSAAVFAWSEQNAVSGDAFLAALALGIEITCRLSNVLVLPPSRFNVGFYVTGLTAPIGVAVAVGNLLQLDAERMNWAISIAASQSSGFRATHGTMTAHFRPGHAARSGIWAALLAQRGFTGNEFALEANKGFVDVFSVDADLEKAVDGLGEHHELLNNAYKPYPCGIVIHPTLDACLDLHGQYGVETVPVRAKLRVHPLALSLCGIREPTTTLESLNSLYHWAAVALVRGRAGVPEMLPDCIADPRVAQLRSRIEVVTDLSVGKEQAQAEVVLANGRTLQTHVLQTRGSKLRPMTDEDLDTKFRSQAGLVLPAPRVEKLRELCRSAASLRNIGREISAVLSDA
jgi:2-methylcitrate dehydratase PrpD